MSYFLFFYFVKDGRVYIYIFDQFQCLGQTWYLDNDMQMLLVAPLIIYPLWRLKKWGLFVTCELKFLIIHRNFRIRVQINCLIHEIPINLLRRV
jgi:hypothetical protein